MGWPWRGGSGGGVALVDEAGADLASVGLLAVPDRDDLVGVVGCALVDRAVGPVVAVVIDVGGEESSELGFAPDEGAVEELVTQGPYPSLRVGVRRQGYRGDAQHVDT